MSAEVRARSLRARLLSAGVICACLAAASSSGAQQPTRRPDQRTQPPRRQETIEIRGQVPTPQVVTVRPREAPTYSRRVLVPAFFDHDFWPSILPPLEIVGPVRAPRDSTMRPAGDSAARAGTPARPPSGTPPAPPRRR